MYLYLCFLVPVSDPGIGPLQALNSYLQNILSFQLYLIVYLLYMYLYLFVTPALDHYTPQLVSAKYTFFFTVFDCVFVVYVFVFVRDPGIGPLHALNSYLPNILSFQLYLIVYLLYLS